MANRRLLVLTGPGGDVHGAVIVKYLSDVDVDEAVTIADTEFNQNLTVVELERRSDLSGLRRWLRSRNGA